MLFNLFVGIVGTLLGTLILYISRRIWVIFQEKRSSIPSGALSLLAWILVLFFLWLISSFIAGMYYSMFLIIEKYIMLFENPRLWRLLTIGFFGIAILVSFSFFGFLKFISRPTNEELDELIELRQKELTESSEQNLLAECGNDDNNEINHK